MSNEQVDIDVVVHPQLNEFMSSIKQAEESVKGVSQEVGSMLSGAFKDVSNSYTQLQGFSFDSMPAEFQSYISSIFSAMKTQLTQITSGIEKINGQNITKEIQDNLIKGIKTSIGMFTSNLADMTFSSSVMKNITSKVGTNMSKVFESNFSDMLRSATDKIGRSFSLGGPATDATWLKMLNLDRQFSAGASAFAKMVGITSKEMESVTQAMIRTQPSIMRSSHMSNAISKSNGAMREITALPTYQNYQERLPEFYRKLQTNPQMQTAQSIRDNKTLQGRLSPAEYTALKDMVAKNPALEKAFRMAGLAYRDTAQKQAGMLMMPNEPLTRYQLASAIGHLHKNVLIPSLEGTPSFYRSITSPKAEDQQRIANSNSSDVLNSINALSMLAKTGVMPIYTRVKGAPNKRTAAATFSPVFGSALQGARPDQYQIMSLTLDDFKKGIILDPKLEAQSAYEERPRGVSTNKMIGESAFTRLIGMRGHNTLGNGSKTQNNTPAMIQIDLSQEMFEKDAKGNLVWENGQPKMSASMKKQVAEMFIPQKDKGYPTVPWGDRGSYVPVMAKRGVITAVREQNYIDAMNSSIKATGYNVLTNMLDPNHVFRTYDEMNKAIEARNRFATPSKSFSEVGGAMPSADKIAFVDLKALTGHDGSAFFMPGYIPGKNATYRASGIKGQAQTVDYKQAIKDIYGLSDTDQFYVPAVNAPQAIKEMFSKGGLPAIRRQMEQGQLSQEDFNKYMLDIMKYEALIPDSLLKSPVYKGLQNLDAAKLFVKSDFGLVQTAAQFKTSKNSLGRQMSQSLDLTPEQIAANEKAWEDYINMLKFDTAGTINTLFSDPNASLDKRVRDNPALLQSDPLARKRVYDEIVNARISQMNGEIRSPGDIGMALASANMFDIIMKLGAANRLQVKDQNLARVLSLKGKAGQDYVGAGFLDDDVIAGGRWPATPGEQYVLNVNKQFMEYARKYGAADDVIYVNPDTIAKMGGGDVDGDTIQYLRGRLQKLVESSAAQRNAKYGTRNNNLKPESVEINRAANPGDMADLIYRQAVQSIRLGMISNAQDALQQINWNDDEWVKQVGQAGADLAVMYDIDSTFMKTGIGAQWTRSAKNAQKLGKPFSHVFNDIVGAVETGDYSKFTDFSKVNFPSRYHALTASMLASIAKNPLSNNAIDSIIAAQEAKQGITGNEIEGSIEAARANFLRANNRAMASVLTRGSIISTSDKSEMDALLSLWQASVVDEKQRPGISSEREQVLKQQLNEIDSQRNRMHKLEQLGVLEGKKDGYMGLLTQNKLSSDISEFGKAEDDAIQAMNAVVTGANIPMVEATRAWADTQARNDAIAGAQGYAQKQKYSFQQLKTFASDPKEWYKRYSYETRNDRQFTPTSADAHVGTAIDKTLGEWAAIKLAVQKGEREMPNGDYFVDYFNKVLTGTLDYKNAQFKEDERNWIKTLADGKRLFPTLPKEVDAVWKRFSNATRFAANLPQFLQDEEILEVVDKKGVARPQYQVEVEPDLGTFKNGNRVMTTGSIDLSTRNRRSGRITDWDLKPILDYSDKGYSVWDQLNFYQAGRALTPNQIGVIAYNVPEGAPTTQTKDFVKEESDAIATAFRGILDQRLALADKGDKWEDTYNKSYAAQKEREIKEAHDANREVIDKNTGIAMSKAIALQNDITEQERYYDEMAQRHEASIRKRERDGLPDRWRGERYALDMQYEEKRNEYMARGAEKEELSGLARAHDLAVSAYEADLRAAAFGDKSDVNLAIENFNKSIQARMTDSGINKLIEEFDKATQSVERATQAYEEFKREVEAKGDKASKEDLKGIKDGALQIAQLKNLENYYKDLTKEDARRKVITGIEDAEGSQLGRGLTFKQSLDRQRDARKRNLMEQQEGLNRLLDKQMITQDEYDQWSDRIERLSSESALNKYIESRQNQHDIEQRDRSGKAYASLFAANNSQRLSIFGNGLTNLGRATNAAYQRMEKGENEYLNSRIQYLSEQEKRNQAMQIQDWEKAAAHDANMKILEQQGRNARYGNGVAGFITSYFQNRYAEASRQYGAARSNYFEKKDAYDREQEILNSMMEKGESKRKINKQEKITQSKEAEVKDAANAMNQLKSQMDGAQVATQAFNATFGAVAGTFQTVTRVVSRFASQFGRRIFMNAIREATQFVKQYDTTMRQIQAITLKSDAEMQGIRTSSINQAVRLRTSTQNVAQVKADLYRQGLSDSEVNQRSESILKFATVTGTKVQAATKIITTALQNDLVASAEHAMDVLTALGDTAATTAEEIGKGMQKSAAAAKVAGVSYEELASMLTIITSRTQLGGNQAGTALQAIFNRMHRVSTSNLVADQNGETTTVNDVEKALKGAGVSLRNEQGNFRDTVDVLRDLAKVWEELNDVQKNAVMYAMAGGRQSNMFASLMEGLSEDNGVEFDRLLGLAEDSNGTTQTKYEIAVSGINGALEQLKATWDSLVSDAVESGTIQSIIEGVTKLVSGLKQLASEGQLLPTILKTITAAMVFMTGKQLILAAAQLYLRQAISGVGGIALAAAGAAGMYLGFKGIETQINSSMSAAERAPKIDNSPSMASSYAQIENAYNERASKAGRAKDLLNSVVSAHTTKNGSYDNATLSDSEIQNIYKAFEVMKDAGVKTSYQVDQVVSSFDKLVVSVGEVSAEMDRLSASAKTYEKSKEIEEANEYFLSLFGQGTVNSTNSATTRIMLGKTLWGTLPQTNSYAGTGITKGTAKNGVEVYSFGKIGENDPLKEWITLDDKGNVTLGPKAIEAGYQTLSTYFTDTIDGYNNDIHDLAGLYGGVSGIKETTWNGKNQNIKNAVMFGKSGSTKDVGTLAVLDDGSVVYIAGNQSYNYRTYSNDIVKSQNGTFGSSARAAAMNRNARYNTAQWLFNAGYDETGDEQDNALLDLLYTYLMDDITEMLHGDVKTLGEFTSATTLKGKTQALGQYKNKVVDMFVRAFGEDDFRRWLDPEFGRSEQVDTMIEKLSANLEDLDQIQIAQLQKYLKSRELSGVAADKLDTSVVLNAADKIRNKEIEIELSDNDLPYRLGLQNGGYLGFADLTAESLVEYATKRGLLDAIGLSQQNSKEENLRLATDIINNSPDIEQHGNNGQYSLVNMTPLSAAEQVVNAMTPADRKYDREYAGLWRAFSGQTNRAAFNRSAGVAYSVAVLKDLELARMLADKTGKYSDEQIQDYLYSQTFGASQAEHYNNINKTARSVSEMQHYESRLSDFVNGNPDVAELQQTEYKYIADAIGWTPTQVMNNPRAALQQYETRVTQQRTGYLSSATKDTINAAGGSINLSGVQGILTDKNGNVQFDSNGRIMFGEQEDINKAVWDFFAANVEGFDQTGYSADKAQNLFTDDMIAFLTEAGYGDIVKNGFVNKEKYALAAYRAQNQGVDSIMQQYEANGVKFGLNQQGRLYAFYNGQNVPFDEFADLYDFNKRFTSQEKRSAARDAMKYANWEAYAGSSLYDEETKKMVKESYPELYEFLNLSQSQQESDYGQKLKRDFEIKLTTEGITELEQVGKVLDGTASLVERLKSEGIIKIKAEIEFLNQAGTYSQNMAKLLNGTRSEQDQIAMQVLSMNSDEYYAHRNQNYAEAQRKYRQEIEAENNTIMETINSLDSQEDREARIKELAAKGYTITRDANGKVTDVKLADNFGIYRSNPYDTMERQYTSREISNGLAQFVTNGYQAGTMDNGLLQAMYGSGFTYTNRLGRLIQQEENPAEIEAFKQEYANELAAELHSASLMAYQEEGKLSSSWVQAYQNITSRDAETRRAGQQTLLGEFNRFQTGQSLYESLSSWGDNGAQWAAYSPQALASLQQLGYIAEEEIEYFSDRKNLEELKDRMEQRGKEFNDALNIMMSEIYPDQSFSNMEELKNVLQASADAGDEFAASLLRVLNVMQGTIDVVNGTVETQITNPLSAEDIYDIADEASGYQSKLQQNKIRNRIIELTEGGTSNTGDISTALFNEELLTRKDDWENYLKADTDMANLIARFTSSDGTIDANFAPYARALTNQGKMYIDPRQFVNYATLSNIDSYEGLKSAMGNETYGEDFSEYVSSLNGWDEVQAAMSAIETNEQPENIQRFNDALSKLGITARATLTTALRPWGDQTEEVNDLMKQLTGGAKSASSAIKSFGSTLSSTMNNQFFRSKWRSGDRSKETLEAIASQTGLSKELVESGKFNDLIEEQLSLAEQADAIDIGTFGNSLFANIQDQLNQVISTQQLTLNGVNIDIGQASVTNMQLDEVSSQLGAYLTDEQRAWIETIQAAGMKAHAEATSDGNGNFQLKFVIDDLGKGSRSGGGGGGGGKSAAQKLLEQIKREKEISDHRLKMLQYSESYYEGRGELTNVNTLLGQENTLRKEMIKEYNASIDKLTKKMQKTQKGSDDWYSLREAILSYEEAIEECNNAIDENNRKLKENIQAIRKTRIDLENDVDEEIKNRIQRERDMLDGTVSMQNMVLDAIKARYQSEWDLLAKNIEKQRQALEEEKSMIDERLNKRKEAADEAEKYEELAELKRQYAMVSMDSTRTKDAAALREKISDIEKDLAWSLAENEAQARQESIQDQIDAWDQYSQNGEEDLQYWLDDANNFATEINSILYEQQGTLFDWMKENIKEYAKTLDEAQKQMVQSWEDTFKQMHGMTDTFWDQVDEILMSKAEYLAYKMESEEYQNASDTDKLYKLTEWAQMYDTYTDANKTGAWWSHSDDGYSGLGTDADPNAGKPKGYYGLFGDKRSSLFNTKGEAQQWANDMLVRWMQATDIAVRQGYSGVNVKSEVVEAAVTRALSQAPKASIQAKYKMGGKVDFTGLAWVDGTPTKPESFLDAEDTALVREFLDAAKYVRIKPFMSSIDSGSFGGNNMSIGDVNITITEASFENDADIEEVASRVGDAFVRELSKQGFMTANYAF